MKLMSRMMMIATMSLLLVYGVTSTSAGREVAHTVQMVENTGTQIAGDVGPLDAVASRLVLACAATFLAFLYFEIRNLRRRKLERMIVRRLTACVAPRSRFAAAWNVPAPSLQRRKSPTTSSLVLLVK